MYQIGEGLSGVGCVRALGGRVLGRVSSVGVEVRNLRRQLG